MEEKLSADDARFIMQVCSYCQKEKECPKKRESCMGYKAKNE
jgi:hypothetical protein